MEQYDNISENEIRIIGTSPDQKPAEKPSRNWWYLIAIAVVLLLGVILLLVKGCNKPTHQDEEVTGISTKDSVVADRNSYVEKTDTIINNVSLHIFVPINAKPKLVMGEIKEIPSEYILGAMAADIGLHQEKYQVIGAFVYHGEMMSHSKSKYGFCAMLKDTMVIGNELTTSYFEQTIEEKGDFFRQHALVHEGKVVNKVKSQDEALRRSLCQLNDGRFCIIDTDMRVTFNNFAEALRQYGAREAIALMGSGAAVRWAIDKEGRKYITGADEYSFPDAINYIVWEKTGHKKK